EAPEAMLPIHTFAAHFRGRSTDRALSTSLRPGGVAGSRAGARRPEGTGGSDSSLLLFVLCGSRAAAWRTQPLDSRVVRGLDPCTRWPSRPRSSSAPDR